MCKRTLARTLTALRCIRLDVLSEVEVRRAFFSRFKSSIDVMLLVTTASFLIRFLHHRCGVVRKCGVSIQVDEENISKVTPSRNGIRTHPNHLKHLGERIRSCGKFSNHPSVCAANVRLHFYPCIKRRGCRVGIIYTIPSFLPKADVQNMTRVMICGRKILSGLRRPHCNAPRNVEETLGRGSTEMFSKVQIEHLRSQYSNEQLSGSQFV